MIEQQTQTKWHQLFGAVLEELLTPVGITVQTEVDVSSKPPQVDILLLQRQQAAAWTDEQRQYLPDGVSSPMGCPPRWGGDSHAGQKS